jgi:hypothetical protein
VTLVYPQPDGIFAGLLDEDSDSAIFAGNRAN